VDVLDVLPKSHQSITGFKHNTHLFCPFDQNLFLDSDILMLKNPDSLWHHFSGMGYAVTGLEVSDIYFGTHKSALAFLELLLQRRRRTLKRFGLTHLSRVQSGVIFVSDRHEAKQINEKAQYYLANQEKTHFRSRMKEKGRSEESCEWSLAMSLSHFNVSVFPWFWAENSAQLDFIDAYTRYNEDFTEVSCKFYFDPFTYSFRGLKTPWLRNALHFVFSWIPGKDDHTWVTPYMLHFGWMHQKQPFYDFADRVWNGITLDSDQ
jgi:hypothetical protein